MLRKVLLWVGVVLLAPALIAIAWDGAVAIPFAVLPALLVIGLLCERYIYKPIQTTEPGPGWQKTGERFVDPRSGLPVAVYYNRQTGERRYVAGG